MQRKSGDRGASLVEFALVLPVLTLFLFGIVQFGIVYDRQQSINSGAREGARLGALDITTMDDISRSVLASYGASAAAGEDPTITVSDSTPAVIGTRSPDGSYLISGTSTHSGSPAREDDNTLMPCGRDSPSDFIHVTVSTPYDITIPFFGVQTVDVDAEAEFRCE